MEYVGIALIVVSIAIFCIHKLANSFLGLNLRLKPLVLCGICAMFISIILPRIVVSMTGFIGTMSVLAIFAIIFAYFVAYYDDLHDSTETVGLIEVASSTTLAHKEIGEMEKTEVEKAVDKPAQEINYFLPVIIKEQPENFTALEAEATTLPMKTRHNELESSDETVTEVIGIENELLKESDSDSLDDLLSFAFTQKETKNYSNALTTFLHAYKLYHDNEVAPFLIVEIGNLLKNKGSYDEAINIFMEGRNLPILAHQPTFAQEFVSMIAYLRIIKNILLQYHLGFMPFNKIPAQILEEIEKEFQDWRELA